MKHLFIVTLATFVPTLALAQDSDPREEECAALYPDSIAAYELCLTGDGFPPAPTAPAGRWHLDGSGTCIPRSQIRPCDGEEEHWIARRFEPPAYPFRVTAVRYALYDGFHFSKTAICDASLAHNVQLLVGTSATPDADPTVVASWSVAAGTPGSGDLVFEQGLAFPVDLDEGEYLFVSIQYAGDVTGTCGESSGTSLCVTACDGGSDTYWSFAKEPDYSWASLTSLEISWGADVGVRGYVPK